MKENAKSRNRGIMRSLIIVSILPIVLYLNCGNDGTGPDNRAPVIQSVSVVPENVGVSESASLRCSATDPDNDVLVYTWSAENGTFPNGPAGTFVLWLAPEDTGLYAASVVVSDGKLTDSETIDINVIAISNQAPVIQNIIANPAVVLPGAVTNLTCVADDADGDSLNYMWSSDFGDFPQGTSGSTVQWQAPVEIGEYYVRVLVTDGRIAVQDSIAITVDSPPMAPSDSDPPNGALEQRFDIGLNWSCADPDLDSLYFDIYLGQSQDPPVAGSHQYGTNFAPGKLEPGAMYY